MFLLNPFLNPLSKIKSFPIVQMPPPKYVLGVSKSFKSESAPSLFYAESIFTSNDDVINVDIQDTKIHFKNINAKRMDSVKIISIDKNLIRTVSVFF